MKPFIIGVTWLFTALTAFTVRAQIYSNLYSFTAYTGFPATNNDGAVPYCGLVLSSNALYGTTYEGGANGQGVVFKVNTDSTGFTNLHTFGALSGGFYGANSDGGQLYSTLVLSTNVLYGTATLGGTSGYGVVFRVNTDGSDFTNLHSFSDGAGGPRAGLILSSNVLYGTTTSGGTGYGSVFRINTDGLAFTNLHSFTALTNDAFAPYGGLVLSGSTLYGTAGGGGKLDGGVVFTVSTSGKGYTNLFNFQPVGGESQSSTNTTGGTPYASLLLLGNKLYGTTPHGGTNGNGVVFAVGTNGGSFTNLHTFSAILNGTNSDGYDPQAPLLLISNRLYGVAGSGGIGGYGTVFSLNTNGTGFTTVYNFVDIPNPTNYLDMGGAGPAGGLLLSGNILYGTTTLGGGYDGNVYAINLSTPTLPVPLGAQITGGKLVFTWTNPAFSLQSTPSLAIAFSNVLNAASPYTNTTTAAQQFYRLKAN